jgi:hypothetical protein
MRRRGAGTWRGEEYGSSVAASDAKTPPVRSVTVHRFTVRATEVERFPDELTTLARERSHAVPGLLRVLVLREGSGVAVAAEWDSPESEIAGAAEMYREHLLSGVTRNSTGPSEIHHYAVLAMIEPQA